MRAKPAPSEERMTAVRSAGSSQRVGAARISRIDREPFDQDFPGLGGFARERVEMRPRAFWIDIIRRDR